jgi:DNA-binding NtrC family response regulator
MEEFRVLFIDDEEELVTTLVERLRYRGIEAEYTLNGPDALEKLRQSDFNVVVLDLKLPGMSGADVLKNIKRDYPQLPVLMITGHGSSAEMTEDKPPGAFDYLAKPINLDDLIAKMREAMEGS